MQFKQADILSGLDKAFIGRIMAAGTKAVYEKGVVLFSEGDPAQHFFIMLKGRIRLSAGDTKGAIYTVNHGGEAFGWSALIGRNTYTATAICSDQSVLISFNHDEIEKLLYEEPRNAVIFYKNLSMTLGNRLVMTASQLTDHLNAESTVSYGTGQVQEAAEPV